MGRMKNLWIDLQNEFALAAAEEQYFLEWQEEEERNRQEVLDATEHYNNPNIDFCPSCGMPYNGFECMRCGFDTDIDFPSPSGDLPF